MRGIRIWYFRREKRFFGENFSKITYKGFLKKNFWKFFAKKTQKYDFFSYPVVLSYLCSLLYNKKFFRVNLEKIFGDMGGNELDPEVSKVLNNLQKKLNNVLDKLSRQFVASLQPNIQQQINKLGTLLTKIKGPQLQKTQVQPVRIKIFVWFVMAKKLGSWCGFGATYGFIRRFVTKVCSTMWENSAEIYP
jgi:hypothetical protein